MIVRFSVENWMSFRNRVGFSMIATRERQHGARVPKIGKYQTKLLPVAAIYGGNASGKTNLFKALNFAKRFVVRGTQPDSLIPIEAFQLDAKSMERPSRFSFEMLIDDTIYEFCFAANRKMVIEETLSIISKSKERVLYNRRDGRPNFDAPLAKDKFMQFAFQGTRENQLFLTNAVSQKVDTFKPVYQWFKESLTLVAPDSRFDPLERFVDEEDPLYATMNRMLPLLDTGIAYLGGEVISFDNLPVPEGLKAKIYGDLQEGLTEGMSGDIQIDNNRFAVARKNGNLIIKKLVAFHTKNGGKDVKFEISQESDGSQRVIDLLPAFLDLSSQQSKKVYVIDEIDRSLHPLLTRKLLELYLGNCAAETRAQLLFTTHDALLMDQQLLRRDEMWVTERNTQGESSLFSFSEYKDVRYDKDIRKSYLQGRLGGIPRILLEAGVPNPCLGEADGMDG